MIIGILLIAVGGALAKLFTAENWERRKARIWKKEMKG